MLQCLRQWLLALVMILLPIVSQDNERRAHL